MSEFETPEPKEGLQGIKIPKPPTLSGDGINRNESKIDNWSKKVNDYLRLAKIPTINQPAVITYFLEGSAEELYYTKRDEAKNNQNELDLEEFFKYLTTYLVPSTKINNYWKQWNNIRQVKDGKVDRISNTVIEITIKAAKLGEDIWVGARIQKLLYAVHSKLREKLEPEVTERTEKDLPNIIQRAEMVDSILYQTGVYKSKGDSRDRQPRTAALNQPNQNNWNSKPNYGNRKKLSPQEMSNLRTQKKCFFCKELDILSTTAINARTKTRTERSIGQHAHK